MKNPKSFYKKLKNLIENEIPENCMLCYDTGQMMVYVVKKDAEFIEYKSNSGGTGWHGVLTPVTEPHAGEGYDYKSIVGNEGIEIELAAVQSYQDD